MRYFISSAKTFPKLWSIYHQNQQTSRWPHDPLLWLFALCKCFLNVLKTFKPQSKISRSSSLTNPIQKPWDPSPCELAVKAILTEVRVVLRQTTIPQMCLLVWQKTNIYLNTKATPYRRQLLWKVYKGFGRAWWSGRHLSLSFPLSLILIRITLLFHLLKATSQLCVQSWVWLPHCISSNGRFKLENTDSTSFC